MMAQLRFFYKLTSEHIRPNAFQKLSVKLATQVFSKGVSMGIFAAIANDFFTETEKSTAISTATFIGWLNKLFDNLNSVSRFASNPDKNAISKEQIDILENLKNASQQISSWKSEGKMTIPYCFSGLQQTINGVLSLWYYVSRDPEQHFLITSHLNQDPIENNISMIRTNRGSYEKNPSAFRVCRNLKIICFQNLKSSSYSGYECSNSTNLLEQTSRTSLNTSITCEIDDDETSLETIEAAIEDHEENDIKDILEIINENKIIKCVALKNCANAYVAGWFAHKFISKNKCVFCKNYFKESHNLEKKTAKLINLRAYKSKSSEQRLPCGSLTTPSDMFENDLKEITSIFDKFFKHFKSKPHVSINMISVISRNKEFFSHCQSHQDEILNFIVKVLIRFTIKHFNNSLKDNNIKNKILKVRQNNRPLNKKRKSGNYSKRTINCFQQQKERLKKYL